jgi:hypothetical protein
MLLLGQALAQRGGTGSSIETPYPNLTRLGFTLRRGQLSMLAAAPGVGKSALAQDILMRTRIRSLYCCADTDPYTMSLRALAKMSGHTQQQVEKGLAEDSTRSMYEELLAKLWNVQFSFDILGLEDVRDEVFAYAAVHGVFPPIIVVDNLVDVADGGEDEWRGMRHAVAELKKLAQVTGSHVMVLHHATGKYEDGNIPIPLSGLENKVGKIPAQVLTLCQNGNYIKMYVVKNRSGQHDAKAESVYAQLYVDLSTMTFREAS